MLLNDPLRFDIYKLENKLKKGQESYIRFIDDILESKGLTKTLEIIKSSGLGVNLYDNKNQKELFDAVVDHLYRKIEIEDTVILEEFLTEIRHIKSVFNNFIEERDSFFDKHEKVSDKYKVVSYLMSLELHLYSLINKETGFHDITFFPENINDDEYLMSNFFDSAIESSGMILKSFMYNNNDFVGSKRNISPNTLKYSSYHVLYSEIWNRLNDVLEYWKYSDVNVELGENGKALFNVMDKDFQYNNLISNERFINLREGWQMSRLGDMYDQIFSHRDIPEEHKKKIHSSLNYSFAVLYFGSPSLDVEIKGIQLIKWLKAYELIIDECKKFLSKRKKIKTYNLSKVCIIKSTSQWRSLLTRNGFTEDESKIILEVLTFDRKSQDLVDCPLVKVDDDLAVIPSLTSNVDAARALASNFLNKGFNLNFRGTEFETRMKGILDEIGVKNNRLYKKIDGTEYECDIAFIIDQELFFVECKAHVQPYTTRQHANHLFKLHEETSQINRIADFYEENLDLVREQIGVEADFKPLKVHRILLTTSMIGSPLFINGVYITDESSLTKVLYREPPALLYMENGVYKKEESGKFEIYKGNLTAKKLIDFLKHPPQVQIAKELFDEKYISLGLFDILDIVKVNNTFHAGQPNLKLSNEESSLLDKYF